MDLITSFTKTLTDLLNKNEERFSEQSKIIVELQKQLENLVEKNDKLSKDYIKLSEDNKMFIEKQDKLSEDNKALNEQQSKLIEDNVKLQSQLDVFNKHLKVEDISKWILVNKGLADEVIKLSDSKIIIEKKLESLSNADENMSKQLSTLAKKIHSPHHHQQAPRYGRYTQAAVGVGGVMSPTGHNVIQGLNNNTTEHHQLYHHQPPYRNPHFVDSIDPDDELGVISDQVEDLQRSVNKMVILQQSFEKSNSFYSDE